MQPGGSKQNSQGFPSPLAGASTLQAQALARKAFQSTASPLKILELVAVEILAVALQLAGGAG